MKGKITKHSRLNTNSKNITLIFLFISLFVGCNNFPDHKYNIGSEVKRVIIAPNLSVLFIFNVEGAKTNTSIMEGVKTKWKMSWDSKNRFNERYIIYEFSDGSKYESIHFRDTLAYYNYGVEHKMGIIQESFRFGSAKKSNAYFYNDEYVKIYSNYGMQMSQQIVTIVDSCYKKYLLFSDKGFCLSKNILNDKFKEISIDEFYLAEKAFYERMDSVKNGIEIAGLVYDERLDVKNIQVN